MSAGSPSVEDSYGGCGIAATAGSGFTGPTAAEGRTTSATVSVALIRPSIPVDGGPPSTRRMVCAAKRSRGARRECPYSDRVPDFPYARLRRFPDVEAPNLQAWDATDELLVARALELAAESGIPGSAIAVIGDGYGALTLPLVAAGLQGVRVHQDLVTGRRALQRNASALASPTPVPDAPALPSARASENGETSGVSGIAHARHAADPLCFPTDETGGARQFRLFTPRELDQDLLRDARLVLLQLPKGLAELEEIADAIARWAAPDVVLLAGGRVKHMTLAQNEVLARFFRRVQPQRAERKSRLIVAADPLPVPDGSALPRVDDAGRVRAHARARTAEPSPETGSTSARACCST